MKTKFIKKATMLIVIATTLIMSLALSPKKNVDNQVMIYGIVYMQECNSESYQYFTNELVDASNYYVKQKEMETRLRKSHPNAKKIRVGSSKNDYGTSATNMCVIQWEKEASNFCYYKVVAVAFGKSQSEASNNAIEKKDTWGGKNTNYSILESKYW